MKIALNARLLFEPVLRGWTRYTLNLARELVLLGTDLLLYSDKPIDPTHLQTIGLSPDCVRVGDGMKYLSWEQFWIPRQCRIDGVELFHSPFNFSLPLRNSCPQVLTLHDAIGYAQQIKLRDAIRPDALKSRFYDWSARTGADLVITVSEYSKQDLLRRTSIPSERIRVVYEAADDRFSASVDRAARDRIRSQLGFTNPYVLYIGGWESRKNVPFLLRAFAAAEVDGLRLVLGGGKKDQLSAMNHLAESLGISDRVRMLTWLDDHDLPAFYAEALCFVYPSNYEGFGLQLTEAMAAGCPTFAAAATSLPEILGSGGETFSLSSEHQLVGLLRQVAGKPQYRESLRVRAKQRSVEFSWRSTAQKTIAVYRELASAKTDHSRAANLS